MKRLLHAFLLLAFSFSFCLAQKKVNPSSAQTLRLAQATYESGRLHEVEAFLKDFVSNSKQEQVQAHKLLCLTFIYLEEPAKADEQMLKILNTDHYFRLSDADPAEFVALYKTFRTKEIYRVGVALGVNATQPNVSDRFTTVDGSSNSYRQKIAFQFGAIGELPVFQKSPNKILKQMSLVAGLGYQQKVFEINGENNQGDGDKNKTLGDEKQTWISLPVLAQLTLERKKINPFVALGVSTDLLLNSSLTTARTRENETSLEPKTFDIKSTKKSINLSAVASVGAKLQLAGGFLIGEVRYIYGLSTHTKTSSSYENPELYLTYGIPNTNYKLNSVSITVGYVYNIFNPKKLNR